MHLVAQPKPVILRLKAAGIGSETSMLGHGTDLKVVTKLAYVSWGNSDDPNHPGGFEPFSVTNPLVPVRLGAQPESKIEFLPGLAIVSVGNLYGRFFFG
jgi:hypothetical protein